MADNKSAGALYYKIAIDKRIDADDGYGNTISSWQEQFTCRSEMIPLRGSESVIASRLQGKNIAVFRVRASSNTRTITTDNQLRDVRRGIAYNIRAVEWEVNRQFIALTCESGVATG